MKVLIDAFHHVVKDEEKLLTSRKFHEFKSLLSDDTWVKLIHGYSLKVASTAIIDDEHVNLAAICAVLHVVFELGVLTGIEMEKS